MRCTQKSSHYYKTNGIGTLSNYMRVPEVLIFYSSLTTGMQKSIPDFLELKVVTDEKIGGSGVISTLGTWCGGMVMDVLLTFNEAAILYRDFNCAPSQKQNIIVFAANNSRCCECHVAPIIIL